MEDGYLGNKELQFVDFMEKERDSVVERAEEISHGSSVETKLELRLGPPGGDWPLRNISKVSKEKEHEFAYSNGFFSKNSCSQISSVLKPPCPEKTRTRSFHLESAKSEFKHVQLLSELSQPCGGRVNPEIQNPENKLFHQAPGLSPVHNCSSSQKRTSPAPVVGWPPIRSFPKKLGTGSSSKLVTQSADEALTERCMPLFVKINMDGVPIGRKIDINAYDNYEKLSMAIDELFRDLLPAQTNSCEDKTKGDRDGRMVTTSILKESREYTLVYEDNEGDRMLVGDLPWLMFVSTVKRLRVLKTTELPKLQNGCKLGKVP